MQEKCVKVRLLDAPLFLDREYDYSLPAHLADAVPLSPADIFLTAKLISVYILAFFQKNPVFLLPAGLEAQSCSDIFKFIAPP